VEKLSLNILQVFFDVAATENLPLLDSLEWSKRIESVLQMSNIDTGSSNLVDHKVTSDPAAVTKWSLSTQQQALILCSVISYLTT
jgi:hypothetical protein